MSSNCKWRAIEGFPGYYVSSTGLVKKYFPSNDKTKILSPTTNNCGYLIIGIYNSFGRRCWFSVHHLVADAYLEHISEVDEVDHINGIKTDNRADNLVWISRRDNVRKARCKKVTFNGKEYDSLLEASIDNGFNYKYFLRKAKKEGLRNE